MCIFTYLCTCTEFICDSMFIVYFCSEEEDKMFTDVSLLYHYTLKLKAF